VITRWALASVCANGDLRIRWQLLGQAREDLFSHVDFPAADYTLRHTARVIDDQLDPFMANTPYPPTPSRALDAWILDGRRGITSFDQ
jgi:hypothetical protein